MFIISMLPALLLFEGAGHSDPSSEKTDDRRIRLLARIERGVSRVNTLRCDFVEEKHLAMLEKTAVSRGRFYFERPDRLRWEQWEPTPSGFAVQGSRAVRWSGANSAYEAFELDRAPGIKILVAHVFAWVRADFRWLEKGYHIRVLDETPVTLKLLPTSEAEAAFLDHLWMVFATDLSHVRTVEIHQRDGDFTRIRFTNPLVNAPPRKNLF